jgi:hypothetical protein
LVGQLRRQPPEPSFHHLAGVLRGVPRVVPAQRADGPKDSRVMHHDTRCDESGGVRAPLHENDALSSRGHQPRT